MNNSLKLAILVGVVGCTTAVQQTTEANSEEDIQLDTALHVVEELKSVPLVLGENEFGQLKLTKDMQLSLDSLESAFPDFAIIESVGHQDGPDFKMFDLMKDTSRVAWVKMNDEDPNLVDRITLTDPTIFDEYGFKIGDSFEHLLNTRPGLEAVITDHYHIIASEVGSPVGYELVGYWSGPDKREVDKDSLLHCTVEKVVWFNPDF